LGQILIEEGYITDKVLENFVQEQIQDTIFDLMRWDEGEFDFELLPDVVDEDIGLAVSIENVIMEGSRRLEEWTRIKKKIPSMDIVFKMATAPGEGTFEISLKPIEWNLLLLVDGTRSVSELAGQTNRTDFEVSRIMYGLFSAGLLEVAADDEVETLRAERLEREAIVAQSKAQQLAIENQAKDDAQVRESALEAEAESRLVAAASDDVEDQAVIEVLESETAESLIDRPEPEVPEFLAGDAATAASASDMAVFEEMMGAVLETPMSPFIESESEPFVQLEPEPEPVFELEPEPVLEPVVEPEPEPELALQSAFEADSGFGMDTLVDTMPSFSDEASELSSLEPRIDTPAVSEGSPDEPMVYEFDFTTTPDQVTEPLIVPAQEVPFTDSEVSEFGVSDDADLMVVDGALDALRAELALEAEESQSPSTGSLTGDLERDLMSLGLGELPTSVYSAPAQDMDTGDDVEPVIDVSVDMGAEAFSDLTALTEQLDEVTRSVPDLSDILQSLDSVEG
ncbi:MAG: DUF4388 domain-containing protein, partial [Coriobacteriia bacterium]|nr:DUF4388 domain-containing protein [Coriobacteriia bacterium]